MNKPFRPPQVGPSHAAARARQGNQNPPRAAVQPKLATPPPRTPGRPAALPTNRAQAVPKVLQAKTAAGLKPVAPVPQRQAAPPAYRPAPQPPQAAVQRKPSVPAANVRAAAARPSPQSPRQTQQQVIQREAWVGNRATYHIHYDINQPHYKYGRDDGSRIDIGPDGAYRVADLQEVIDLLRGNGDAHARACYDWCLREASAIRRNATARAERRAQARGW